MHHGQRLIHFGFTGMRYDEVRGEEKSTRRNIDIGNEFLLMMIWYFLSCLDCNLEGLFCKEDAPVCYVHAHSWNGLTSPAFSIHLQFATESPANWVVKLWDW